MRSFAISEHYKSGLIKSIFHDLQFASNPESQIYLHQTDPYDEKFKVALLMQSAICQCKLSKSQF